MLADAGNGRPSEQQIGAVGPEGGDGVSKTLKIGAIVGLMEGACGIERQSRPSDRGAAIA